MKKKDCFYLGKIVKPFSFKGEVLIKLDTDEPESYENIDAVFIEVKDNLIPFFVEQSKLHKSDLLRVKFEDIDNENDVNSLLKCDLYLPLSALPKLNYDQFYFHEVIGFDVVDSIKGLIGTIKYINDNTAQTLIVIENENKEVLIPMNDDIIDSVNKSDKKIYITAPEGLIDLYLNE